MLTLFFAVTLQDLRDAPNDSELERLANRLIQENPGNRDAVVSIMIDRLTNETRFHFVQQYANWIATNAQDHVAEIVPLMVDRLANETFIHIMLQYADWIATNARDRIAEIVSLMVDRLTNETRFHFVRQYANWIATNAQDHVAKIVPLMVDRLTNETRFHFVLQYADWIATNARDRVAEIVPLMVERLLNERVRYLGQKYADWINGILPQLTPDQQTRVLENISEDVIPAIEQKDPNLAQWIRQEKRQLKRLRTEEAAELGLGTYSDASTVRNLPEDIHGRIRSFAIGEEPSQYQQRLQGIRRSRQAIVENREAERQTVQEPADE